VDNFRKRRTGRIKKVFDFECRLKSSHASRVNQACAKLGRKSLEDEQAKGSFRGIEAGGLTPACGAITFSEKLSMQEPSVALSFGSKLQWSIEYSRRMKKCGNIDR